ncbi:MAG: alpha/beta fold hydrolase [Phycisphaerales bacterium]
MQDDPADPAGPLASCPRPVTASAHDRVTGVDIRIDRLGSGDPIVFLNGLLGQNEQWFGVLGPIAARGECVLIQPPLLKMRGAGGTVLGVTRVVESVLDALVDRPAVLVGNSLGGHMALRIAAARPDLVRGIALIGSSGLFEKSFEQGVQRDPSRQWLDAKIRELFADDSRLEPGLVDRVYEELRNRHSARAFVKLGRSAKRDHLGSLLPEVRAPVELIWGRQDVVTPPSVAEEFARLLPEARIHWIDSCGHAPQLERPDALARAIGGFLDRIGFPLAQDAVLDRARRGDGQRLSSPMRNSG